MCLGLEGYLHGLELLSFSLSTGATSTGHGCGVDSDRALKD
jgi:hypothetical protein